MAKELSKGTKIGIAIGILATVGITGYIGYRIVKEIRDRRNGIVDDQKYSGDSQKGLSSSKVNSSPVVKTNFEALKSNISSYKNMGDYVVYETTPSSLGISASSLGLLSKHDKIIVKFTASGFFGVFINDIKLTNKIVEGNYSDGGKKLVVTIGKNKGLIVDGNSVSTNIKKTLA